MFFRFQCAGAVRVYQLSGTPVWNVFVVFRLISHFPPQHPYFTLHPSDALVYRFLLVQSSVLSIPVPLSTRCRTTTVPHDFSSQRHERFRALQRRTGRVEIRSPLVAHQNRHARPESDSDQTDENGFHVSVKFLPTAAALCPVRFVRLNFTPPPNPHDYNGVASDIETDLGTVLFVPVGCAQGLGAYDTVVKKDGLRLRCP